MRLLHICGAHRLRTLRLAHRGCPLVTFQSPPSHLGGGGGTRNLSRLRQTSSLPAALNTLPWDGRCPHLCRPVHHAGLFRPPHRMAGGPPSRYTIVCDAQMWNKNLVLVPNDMGPGCQVRTGCQGRGVREPEPFPLLGRGQGEGYSPPFSPTAKTPTSSEKLT